MGNSSKRDVRSADTQLKRKDALDMRRQGMGYREIAKALDCSLGNAHKLVETAIAQIPVESAEDVRRIELARLDRMLRGVSKYANTGDPKAILAVVKIMDRRAKYLGLDAPSKVALEGKDGGPIQFDPRSLTNEQLAELAAGAWPAAAGDRGGSGTRETSAPARSDTAGLRADAEPALDAADAFGPDSRGSGAG